MFSPFLWIVEAGGFPKEMMKNRKGKVKLVIVDRKLVVALTKEAHAIMG